jgi:L-threonylcarbamoyladenylate synthase
MVSTEDTVVPRKRLKARAHITRQNGGVLQMIVPATAAAHLRAAEIIQRGGVVAFRTDTFYGLGADPKNAHAVRKIRDLKGREEQKPILLLISDSNHTQSFIGKTSESFEAIAKHFWPGPLTLIGIAREELPFELTAGTGSVGVRLPDGNDLRALLRACGGALTATSANLSGKPPARTAQQVEHYFPTGVDLIIDGGEATASQPSTVLDLSEEEICFIREGAITRVEIEKFLSE